MKYTTGMLKKYMTKSLDINDIYDFSEDAKQTGDILRVEPTHVDGEAYYYRDTEEFVFNVDVKTTVYMQCAITLVEIPIQIEFNREYVFKEKLNEEDDDIYVIDGHTMHLDKVVWSDILIEKPMKVTVEDAEPEDIGALNESDLSTKELKINNQFAGLKDFFKDK